MRFETKHSGATKFVKVVQTARMHIVKLNRCHSAICMCQSRRSIVWAVHMASAQWRQPHEQPRGSVAAWEDVSLLQTGIADLLTACC